jgi:hypothetical protein
MTAWSDWKKWRMGLLEKAILLSVGGVLSFLLVDRYRAALDERDARQGQLWTQIERVEQASLDYNVNLYDAYMTPCGSAGRDAVRRLQDEYYRSLKFEIDRVRNARQLLFDPGRAERADEVAGKYWKQIETTYRSHVVPRLGCECPQGADRLQPIGNCPGDRDAFRRDFQLVDTRRGELLHAMYDQYGQRAARLMLPAVLSR